MSVTMNVNCTHVLRDGLCGCSSVKRGFFGLDPTCRILYGKDCEFQQEHGLSQKPPPPPPPIHSKKIYLEKKSDGNFISNVELDIIEIKKRLDALEKRGSE